VLVVLGVIGFLTVADDWRHKGELIGVGSVLVGGIILVGTGSQRPILRRVAMPYLAFGLFAGAVLGAVLDNMMLGVGVGGALGLLAALIGARRQP
jgi:hypothetical protein